MSTPVSISAVFKLHQRAYEREHPLVQGAFGLIEGSWIWEALLHASRTSKLKAKSSSDIRQLLALLECLAEDQAWLDLANLETGKLTLEDIVAAFGALEVEIQRQKSWGASTRHRSSLIARNVLTQSLISVGFPKAEGLHNFFRTQLPQARFNRRQLISDQPVHIEGKPQWPVGAIPHETVEQLQRETALALASVIDKIGGVCTRILDQIDLATVRLRELSSLDISQSYIHDILVHQRRDHAPPWIEHVPIRVLAAVYVQVVHEHLDEVAGRKPKEFNHFALQSYLSELYGLPKSTLGLTFFPLGVGMEVMVACLLVLQIHTAWNVNTVLELTTDGISGRQAPFQIQGFKTRVGKSSPIVAVERSDIDVIRAIDFLMWRLAVLKHLGWVSPDETRLWISDSVKDHRPFVGWTPALSVFQKKHGLPHFSWEQVRIQVLCLRGQTGGLEAMRQMAHHKSIRTTGGYAFQLMLYRKNEAINLEFQRRLEREVIFTFEGGKDPRTALLWPIGDGTSCTDPTAPPFDDYIEAGACSARQCHKGDGCINRRVVIDRDRLEEALRVEQYYESNWARLLGQNRDAFEAYHLPSMIFNRALIRFVESGRYAHIVREVRGAIELEATQ